MFDEIHCKMPLPGDAPEFVKQSPFFQTNDLGNGMGQYVITEEGELLLESTMVGIVLSEELGLTMPTFSIPYKRKRIEMYTSNIRGGGPSPEGYTYYTEDGSDYISIAYIVQIRNGKVSSIKEKYREIKPAKPISQMR